MRVKNFWIVLPLAAKVKLFWDRITLTRTATIYFIFSVLHCVVQIIFQVQAFRINAEAADFLGAITEQGNATDPDAFYVLGNDLRLCDTVPTTISTSSCQVVWDGMVGNNTLIPTSDVAAVIMKENGTRPSSSAKTTSRTRVSAISRTSSYSNLSPTTSSSADSTISATPTHSSSPPTTVAEQSHSTTTMRSSSNPASATSSHSDSTPTMTEQSHPTTTMTGPENNSTNSIMSSTAMGHARRGTRNRRTLGKIALFQRSGITEAVVINGTMQVIVNGLGWDQQSAILSDECLWALGWPVQELRNTKREDLTFIMFQIWVLGVSIVALLNESVPHTIASLLTHFVATGWAGFQIFNTAQFRSQFAQVTTNGACSPIDLLPTYWQTRSAAEIPSVVLNGVALLISAFLSWRLGKSYNWQTFKRVGASITITRVYITVLTLSIVIQLSLFFIVASIALWLDQLWNGAIGHLATSPVYRPLLFLTLLLLPPWLACGWYSVRREQKVLILVFLSMCLSYLGGWGAMFDSTTFRWTYMTWTFFGVMTTASVFLTLNSFILGVICRLNFGKGLPHYLNAQQPIEDDFKPLAAGDPEKVAFPSSTEPTYSVAFGSEAPIIPPPQAFARNAVPCLAQPLRVVNPSTLQQPPPAMVPIASEFTYTQPHQQQSQSSVDSFSHRPNDNKRWVIE